MFVNRLQTLWAGGQTALNGWLTLGGGFTAELMAAQGYDALTIDLQHGAMDQSALLPMLQALRASAVTPLVRVPWLDPGTIMRALDAGAHGVICPMVNSAAEAATFAAFMRYPPQGRRSYGPVRARLTEGDDYAAAANGKVLAIAMIETAAAMENLEAIAATPGLDALYIGPADLTLSLSEGRLQPGGDPDDATVRAAIRRIRDAARARGLRAGLHCATAEDAARAAASGFDLVTVSDDARLLATAAAEDVRRFRSLHAAARA